MINEIDILHEGHCCNFACHTGEKPASLLCIVSYHQEVVIKLGEYGFDSFSKIFCKPTMADASFSGSTDKELQV